LINDRYDILDGVAIASLGEVYSVLLAHACRWKHHGGFFCDPASLASLNLLKVLLAETRLESRNSKPLPDYEPLRNAMPCC